MDGSSNARRNRPNSQPATRPMAIPPAPISTNFRPPDHTVTPAAPTAPSAILYAVSAVASLTSDSPSRIVPIRAGPPSRRMIDVAATGSVGPSTAPRTIAGAHAIPTTQWATAATATTVRSTSPIASSPTGTALSRSSYAEVENAA